MILLANKTEPSRAEIELIHIEEKAGKAMDTLRQVTVEAFDALWNCGRTAEMLGLMGTNAVAAFTQHAKSVEFLLASGVGLDPKEYTPPAEYTAHEDGTVTLA